MTTLLYRDIMTSFQMKKLWLRVFHAVHLAPTSLLHPEYPSPLRHTRFISAFISAHHPFTIPCVSYLLPQRCCITKHSESEQSKWKSLVLSQESTGKLDRPVGLGQAWPLLSVFPSGTLPRGGWLRMASAGMAWISTWSLIFEKVSLGLFSWWRPTPQRRGTNTPRCGHVY